MTIYFYKEEYDKNTNRNTILEESLTFESKF